MSLLKNTHMRIAHISDLHFAKVTFSPTQFLSKRFLGNLYLLFKRGREFKAHRLTNFAKYLKEQHVDFVIITGDFSQTARDIEFEMAFDFLDELKAENLPTFCIPGNHDAYTKKAYLSKRFYDFFDHDFDQKFPFTLKMDGFEIHPLGKHYFWVGIDCAKHTPLHASYGIFDEKLETKLKKGLSLIPKEKHIIFCNHFPFRQSSAKRSHSLLRAHALESLLKQYPNIQLYLHGHEHKHAILDLREENLPICIDSGSASHQMKGSFNLLDLSKNHMTVHSLKANHFLPPNIHWEKFSETQFEL
ncbi:MAG: 3',5'-cyclic adenosine monophosphate phosphodiesterase CpdA [Chlamydiae bacterium]|nr:3',5'-cyclic adenosine monophosphate phosphodiesterase CpdA [Chlamydiota bacterium]